MQGRFNTEIGHISIQNSGVNKDFFSKTEAVIQDSNLGFKWI